MQTVIEQNTRKGILLMVATTIVFASQDGFSRHLAQEYNVMMVVMIRYWFFAAFVMAISARKVGGLRGVAATKQPFLQAFRGVLLAAEICVAILSFTLLGLVESHAIFACYPLLIAALSGPILGEKVGWRRWAAIGTGFIGILVILNPGVTVFAVEALIPLASALMFAVYGLLTRYVSREDSAATSFFWTGTTGAIFMTLVGIWLSTQWHRLWIWDGRTLCSWGAWPLPVDPACMKLKPAPCSPSPFAIALCVHYRISSLAMCCAKTWRLGAAPWS